MWTFNAGSPFMSRTAESKDAGSDPSAWLRASALTFHLRLDNVWASLGNNSVSKLLDALAGDRLPALTSLSLASIPLSAARVAVLAGASLRHLDLSDCALSDAALADFAPRSAVEHLNIAKNKVRDGVIALIFGCRHLVALNADATRATSDALMAAMSSPSPLQTLILTHCDLSTDLCASALRHNTVLTRLELAHAHLSESVATLCLSHFGGLRVIDLSDNPCGATPFVRAPPCPTLEVLQLQHTAVGTHALAAIAHLPCLTELNLAWNHCGVTKEGLAYIVTMPTLKHLALGRIELPLKTFVAAVNTSSSLTRLAVDTSFSHYVDMLASAFRENLTLAEVAIYTSRRSYCFAYRGLVRELLRTRVLVLRGRAVATHDNPLVSWLLSHAPLRCLVAVLRRIAEKGHKILEWV